MTSRSGIDYMRAIRDGAHPPAPIDEGRAAQRGSRAATAEGRMLREADGKLLAHGTCTCIILGAA